MQLQTNANCFTRFTNGLQLEKEKDSYADYKLQYILSSILESNNLVGNLQRVSDCDSP